MSVLDNKKIIIANRSYYNYDLIIDSSYSGNTIEASFDNGSTWITLNYNGSDTLYSGGYRLFTRPSTSLLVVNSNSNGLLLVREQGETGLNYVKLYYEAYYSGNPNNNGTIPFSHVFTYTACNGNVFFSQNIQDDGSYSGQPYRLTTSVDGGAIVAFEGHKIFEGGAVDIDPFYNFGTLSSGGHLFRLFFDGNEVYQYGFTIPLDYTCPVTTTTSTTTTTTTTTTQAPTTTSTTTQAPNITAFNLNLGLISGTTGDIVIPTPTTVNCTFNGNYQLASVLPVGVQFLVNGTPIGTGTNFTNSDTLQLVIGNNVATGSYNLVYTAYGSCGSSNANITFDVSNTTTTNSPTTQTPTTTATPTTQAPPIANSITVNVISGNAVALPISCNGLCTVSGIKITQGVGCGLLTSNGNTYQPVVNNIITTYGNLQFESGNCLPNTYVIKYVCLSSCGQSNEGVITINVLPQTTIAPTTQAPTTCDPCTLLNVILQQVLCVKTDVHEIKCKMNKHSTIISY